MELKHIATRSGRLSTFLKQELGLSTGLMNRLKWSEKLYVNGIPRHADFQIAIGDVIIEDVCGTGVSIIATKNVPAC